MPSEKSRYLKSKPQSPHSHQDLKSGLENSPRKEIEDLLLNFSSYGTPLRRTLIVMTAINHYKNDGKISNLKKSLLYALQLDDHVPYNRAGEYCFVIYPVIEFFNEHSDSPKLMKLLQEILPILEESSFLLQDEGSWYEAFEKMSKLPQTRQH